jgi:hypothetical protein
MLSAVAAMRASVLCREGRSGPPVRTLVRSAVSLTVARLCRLLIAVIPSSVPPFIRTVNGRHIKAVFKLSRAIGGCARSSLRPPRASDEPSRGFTYVRTNRRAGDDPPSLPCRSAFAPHVLRLEPLTDVAIRDEDVRPGSRRIVLGHDLKFSAI